MNLVFAKLILTTAVLITLAAGQTAEAKNLMMPRQHHMTLKQIIRWQRQIIKHDKWVIDSRKVHRPEVVRFARKQLIWTQKELKENLAKLRPKYIVLGYPPHHKLWLCISRYEGGVKSVNPNGHYGMLQMSWNWLGYIKGAASNYSQSVQEWAAEKAYRDYHYARSFLYGQWFNYDNAAGECLGYA